MTIRNHSVEFATLDQYGVNVRYPGMTTTVAEAESALKLLRKIRTVIRKKLGL